MSSLIEGYNYDIFISYSFQVAEALALKGDKEESLGWLKNSINRGNFNYPFINEYDPFLENLRKEESFKKLMQRIEREWKNFS